MPLKFCLTCEKWFPEGEMFIGSFCSKECLDWDREHFPVLHTFNNWLSMMMGRDKAA